MTGKNPEVLGIAAQPGGEMIQLVQPGQCVWIAFCGLHPFQLGEQGVHQGEIP
jgi:hypothetical protein